MDLPYRKYYNKPILPVDSSGWRSLEVFLQMSTSEIYHVSYDPEEGFSQCVLLFVDSKRRLRECAYGETRERVNMEGRRDLLRFFLGWSERTGILSDDGLNELVGDLAPLCLHYNNVILVDGVRSMDFCDFKDFSKRKLRSRKTGKWFPPYLSPEVMLDVDRRLTRNEARLADAKARLVAAIEGNRPDDVRRFAALTADLMQDMLRDGERSRKLHEACRYVGRDEE